MTMRWVDTAHYNRSGFVGSRLFGPIKREGPRKHWEDFERNLAEIGRYGATYYLDFTRFAPLELQVGDNYIREFNSLEEAKAYATALITLNT